MDTYTWTDENGMEQTVYGPEAREMRRLAEWTEWVPETGERRYIGETEAQRRKRLTAVADALKFIEEAQQEMRLAVRWNAPSASDTRAMDSLNLAREALRAVKGRPPVAPSSGITARKRVELEARLRAHFTGPFLTWLLSGLDE